ncbi:MAG TPA: sigma-70 family RNA polymerase sigma factor [Thermoanaerobaculia bacterium]|jgi:RNA polymerase sigma-70 factor (ECF subfamily)|nr:sigma-70 family RNA polymerase sigma factor [Thermoanaerobaculia bacterium]
MRASLTAPSSRHRDRFESLALPHLAALHRVAFGLTHHSADAADLVQETLLRAYRTFANFAPGTDEKAWLFTILYSIAANKFRTRQRRPTEVSIEALEEQRQRAVEIADWRGQEEMLGNPRLAWEGSEVARALADLPEPFRVAVQLVDLGELSYEEAAAAAGCPVGTLRSRLFRGRRRLAAQLREVARAAGLPVS